MAMVLMAIDMLIVHMAILIKDFLHQATFHQQGERPIERGPGDALAFGSKARVKFIHIKMVVLREHLRQNGLPLRGETHSFPGQKFLEHFPFGFHN
jgi:hypothetical protein